MFPGTKRQTNISLVLLACAFALSVAPSSAQSLADVARRERERQENLPHPAKHVYSNEDMQRSEILLPEDRKEFEAAHKIPASLADPQPSIMAPGPRPPQEIPLGDVARHYRELNKLQEIQQADKTDVLPAAKPALGSPTITRPAIISIPKPHLKLPRQTYHPGYPTSETLDNANRILINKGDSLWMLAERYLGNGTRWSKILAANPQLKNPNLIHAGEWITLPLDEFPSFSGKVRVHKGDTLWKLAQLNFGNGLAWSCIAEANPSVPDSNRIYSGQILMLPARCNPIR